MIRATKSQKETSLEQKFNDAFFVDLLGYRLYPGLDSHWTAWPKPSTAITRLPGEPDLLLGISRFEEFETVAVVELKKPGTPLDAPQPGYDNRTPVEQAFSYGRKIATCRWVIVSDMQFVRLYSIETMDAYHEIDLWAMDTDGERDTVAEAVHLLSFENLVEHGADSPTARLLSTVREEQAFFRDGFYKVYSDIRADLLEAVEQWSAGRHDRGTLVLAVQRLLDRLLFIYFCEDHPDRLLRHRLLETMVEGAVQQPGPSATKAYDSVKQLFRDLDIGATTQYWSVPRYNGELFKPHDIVDKLSIEDSLHAKRYFWKSPRDKSNRAVNGIFGLHVFDFWRELDRDLLGNLFERSIGDLTALVHGGRPDARKAFGIFYTASRLAKFMARSAVDAILTQNEDLSAALKKASTGSEKEREQAVEDVFQILKKYRIADLACGSGVFLTAALEGLLNPYRKALEAISIDNLTRELHGFRQSEVLKETIFGIDLLPLACTRFRRHRVRCDNGNGGGSWIGGSSRESSSLRLYA